MPYFDDDEQSKRISILRQREEEDLIKNLAESKYGLSYIDLTKVMVQNEALKTIPEKMARDLEVAPFNIVGKRLFVAVHSPQRDDVKELMADLKNKGYQVKYFMASRKSLEKVWDRYIEVSKAEKIKAGSFEVTGEVLKEISEEIKRMEDIKEKIERAEEETGTSKISEIISILFAGAISLGASDVHIEPEEEGVQVRLRIDGVLHDVIKIDQRTYGFINSRIKLLSGLKLSKNKAQDGRFSVFIDEDEVSMRTSIIPGAYGEGIVTRILNPQSIQVDLEDLGIEDRLYEIVEREIEKPNGLILVTGPTGSGKTTTLYSFLRKIYSTEIKILTIEDPVEYHLDGITQTQTKEEKGYGFLEGLRSALRQDPDVIMVGEIRDGETAKIAVESSLTGHIVFSTLHTNNAAGAVPRLIDLGVNPKILSSALSMALAQRLVRKLCPHCKRERAVTDEEEKILRKVLITADGLGKDLNAYGLNPEQNLRLWEPVGCEKCNGIGYKGRIGIFEAVLADDAVQRIMPNNPSEKEIREIAKSQKIMDMKEDGISKALAGITSLEEVKKVVDIYEE